MREAGWASSDTRAGWNRPAPIASNAAIANGRFATSPATCAGSIRRNRPEPISRSSPRRTMLRTVRGATSRSNATSCNRSPSAVAEARASREPSRSAIRTTEAHRRHGAQPSPERDRRTTTTAAPASPSLPGHSRTLRPARSVITNRSPLGQRPTHPLSPGRPAQPAHGPIDTSMGPRRRRIPLGSIKPSYLANNARRYRLAHEKIEGRCDRYHASCCGPERLARRPGDHGPPNHSSCTSTFTDSSSGSMTVLRARTRSSGAPFAVWASRDSFSCIVPPLSRSRSFESD
jgi:hypothetical protein